MRSPQPTIDPENGRFPPSARRWLGVGLAALLLAGCSQAPLELAQVTWKVIQDSERNGGADGAAEMYATAKARYDSAWQIIRAQNERWFVVRDYAAAESLLYDAAKIARQSTIAGREALRDARQGLQTEVRKLDDHLGDLRGEANGHLARISLRKALTTAEMRLAVAEEHAASLPVDQARIAVESAREAVDSFQNLIEKEYHVDGSQRRMWESWVSETVDWTKKNGSPALVVVKARHRAYLVEKGKIVNTFDIELGYGSRKEKQYSGDAATPEGIYSVVRRRERGAKYYKALDLDYPNEYDRRRFAQARKKGWLPASAKIGGSIQVHGEGGRGDDWTNGCVAVANKDMDRIIARMKVGDRVTIVRSIEGWPG
jgi:L,D-peptidoglycan transpeptidase YkuD (ErfK/YbiS/YcfS/YnhG family)